MKKTLIPLLLTLSAGLLLGSCGNGGNTPSSSETPAPTTSTPASSTPVVLDAPVITLDKKNTRLISWKNIAAADGFNVYLDGTLVKENLDDLSYVFPYDKTFAEHKATVKSVKGSTLSVASNEVTIKNNIVSYDSWSGKEDILSDWDISAATNYKEEVGEGFDFGGTGTISIAKTIKSDNKYFTISVRDFEGQETGNDVGSQYTIKVNDTIVKAKGYDTDYVTLPLDTDCWYSHSYDLTSYVGSDVIISVNSINETSSHLVVCSAVMDKASAGILPSGTPSYTDRKSLINGWRVAGNYREGVGEGFDINSYDNSTRSSCSALISIPQNKTIMKVRARVFSGQDDNEHHMVVRVNGVVVKSAGQTENYTVQPGNTDAPFDYFYDLTAYAGKTVEVSIANDAETGHLCLQAVTFSDDNKVFTKTETKKNYTRNEIADDWTLIGYNRDGINEGYDLDSSNDENNDIVRSSLEKIVTVDTSNVLMMVNFRQFAGQEGSEDDSFHDNNAKIRVRVNGVTINPINPKKAGDDFIEDDLAKDGQGNVTGIFSLADYVGETVMVNVCADEKVYHCVIRSISFASYDTATSWDAAALGTSWGYCGDGTISDNGIEINPWDGKNAIYLATTVIAETPVLKITAKMSDTENDNGLVGLTVNGTSVAEENNVSILDKTAVDATVLAYDLTAYAGQKVAISFASLDDSNKGILISAASFVAAIA
jgi:hypothetical protein